MGLVEDLREKLDSLRSSVTDDDSPDLEEQYHEFVDSLDTVDHIMLGILAVSLILLVASLVFGFGITISNAETMKPTFDKDDILLYRGVSFDSISEGDIILYRTQYFPFPIIHRVVNKDTEDRTLETKGDDAATQLRICVSRTDPESFQIPDPRKPCAVGYQVHVIEQAIEPQQVIGRVELIIG